MAQARKGDLVAIETIRTMTYVNDYRSTSSREFSIMRVNSATKDGIVKSVKDVRYGTVSKLAYMCGKPRVHVISTHQDKAERLVAARTPDQWQWFDSADELKAAILAA